MMSEKKYKNCWQLGGLLPISQSWSRYSTLYRDTEGVPGHETAERVRARLAIRLAMRMIQCSDTADLRVRGERRACAHGLARGESRYKNCIVAGGNRLCHNMAQQGCDTALQHGNGVLRHSLRYIRERARHDKQ